MPKKPEPPRVFSTYALLDVKAGRRALKRALESGDAIDVIIRGRLDRDGAGRDDGTSIEFALDVSSVELFPGKETK